MLPVKTKRLLTAVLILSLAAAGVFGWRGVRTPFRHVISLAAAGETAYGVDERDGEYLIFQTDRTGALLGQIRVRDTQEDSYLRYEHLTVDGETLYVVEVRADCRSELIQSETVYRCDFQRGRLEEVWSLPVLDPTQISNHGVQVREGVLTCFQADYQGRRAVGRLLRQAQGEELEEIASFSHDIGEGFTEFYHGPGGQVVYTTPAGGVYLCQAGENAQGRRLYPTGEGNRPLTLFAPDGAGRVYVAGVDGAIQMLNLAGSGRPRPAFDPSGPEPGIQGEDLVRVTLLSFSPEGNFAAAFTGGRRLGFSGEEGLTELTALKAPAGDIAGRALLAFVAVWSLALLLALLRRAFLFLTRGKVPIVTKLLAVFLPILIASMGAMNLLVTRFFTDTLVDEQYERLYLLTSQQTATLNTGYIQGVEPAEAFDSVYFYEIRAALNVLPQQGTLHRPGEGAQPQQTYNANYFWLYKVVDGTAVSLVCEQDYVGVPVEYLYSPAIAENFQTVIRTGNALRTTFEDRLGDWTILLTPVHDEAGEVVAVIETGDAAQSLSYEVGRGARRLTALNLGVMALMALLLSGVIWVSLRPLKTLKARVQEISDGKLGVQAPARSHDEVGEITRVFNTMSKNVAFRDREIRLTSEGYSRFVPSRVFDLLDKSSVIDVRLEDQTSVEATVLNCSVGAFDGIARRLRTKEMFRLINQVLARLVPVVESSGGLVDRFDRAGLLAIYTDRPGRALDAAVTLCQTLRAAAVEEAQGQELDFHVTLSAGPAMIGIVGADRRLEAMTISEHTNFTGFLRPLAAGYGATVLLTASAAERIPDFSTRYHARAIGFVRMRALDRLERLYDVYDADEEQTRRLKEETRELFEQGVTLFCSRRYYDARLLFIEVLKKNREDKAAKNYLYLCDSRYRREEGGEEPIYLEEY